MNGVCYIWICGISNIHAKLLELTILSIFILDRRIKNTKLYFFPIICFFLIFLFFDFFYFLTMAVNQPSSPTKLNFQKFAKNRKKKKCSEKSPSNSDRSIPTGKRCWRRPTCCKGQLWVSKIATISKLSLFRAKLIFLVRKQRQDLKTKQIAASLLKKSGMVREDSVFGDTIVQVDVSVSIFIKISELTHLDF